MEKCKCLVCGAELFQPPLLVLEDMPALAQGILREEETDQGISLRLYQCRGCGLVQSDCGPALYYKDVIRTGGSKTMLNLRKKQYTRMIEDYHLENKKFVEVGCGQGEYLSILAQFPVRAFGVEHKEELVKTAEKKGLRVEKGFVDSWDVRLENGPFDVFLSFNFLEHQPDPNGMLQGIYHNLTEEGMGLITVPSLEYILENESYYELIRDHLAYFTFDTLRFVLDKNGFEIIEQEVVNRDTLSVIVRKKRRIEVCRLKDRYFSICSELNDYISELRKQGKRVAIWGAGHQGFTLASTAKLTEKVEYIIDSAPFKWNGRAPASHIPIIAPEEAQEDPVDAIMIMAPGYTEEIASVIRKMYGTRMEITTVTEGKLLKYGNIER